MFGRRHISRVGSKARSKVNLRALICCGKAERGRGQHRNGVVTGYVSRVLVKGRVGYSQLQQWPHVPLEPRTMPGRLCAVQPSGTVNAVNLYKWGAWAKPAPRPDFAQISITGRRANAVQDWEGVYIQGMRNGYITRPAGPIGGIPAGTEDAPGGEGRVTATGFPAPDLATGILMGGSGASMVGNIDEMSSFISRSSLSGPPVSRQSAQYSHPGSASTRLQPPHVVDARRVQGPVLAGAEVSWELETLRHGDRSQLPSLLGDVHRGLYAGLRGDGALGWTGTG